MPGKLHLANIFQEAFQLTRPGERVAPQNSLQRHLFLFSSDGLPLISEHLVHRRSSGYLRHRWRKCLRVDVSKRFVTFQYLLDSPTWRYKAVQKCSAKTQYKKVTFLPYIKVRSREKDTKRQALLRLSILSHSSSSFGVHKNVHCPHQEAEVMKSSVRRLIKHQYDRRSFFKTLGAAAAGAGATGWFSDEEVLAQEGGAVKNVQRNSIPSQLKITDLRIAVVTGAPMNVPIIRIDTNQ